MKQGLKSRLVGGAKSPLGNFADDGSPPPSYSPKASFDDGRNTQYLPLVFNGI